MKLYILVPNSIIPTYNNYMNNWFKMNDWNDVIIKNNCNFEIEYLNQNSEINPNINEDYLLVTDILSGNKNYYEKIINLFKKENKFVMIYECFMHIGHRWKFEYATKNFNIIFQNSIKLTQKKNIFWIPCYNYFMKHPSYCNTKDKFCCVSPIFDLGFSAPLDNKRTERIGIIKEFCAKDNKIHVYGHKDWIKHISSENYIGKIPNEEDEGIRGVFNLEEKIINKCNLLSQYKFVLVFENLFVDGFVSEKLVESLYSDSVVIYYGPKNIKEMYRNLFTNGVINGHDYDTNQILYMMNYISDEEYENRVKKIRSIRNVLNYENSSENVKDIVINKIKDYIAT